MQRVSARNPHLRHNDAEKIVNVVLGEITAAMARGDRVELRGFGTFAYRAGAIERARQLAPLLTEFKAAGMSARQIGAELTARGIATPTGARWHPQSVVRMLHRVGH